MDTDIVKLSTDWAKAEVFSGKMVWFFSVLFLLAAIGFWYLGKTTMARAFVWPLLIAGIFLIAVGAGLFFTNSARVTGFEIAYHQNPKAFVQQEISRTDDSEKQFKFVFSILSAIIIISALIIVASPGAPNWKAICITLILTASFLMVVDSNTDARNTAYHSILSASKP
jgi:ABC-2 type transport system permease protein